MFKTDDKLVQICLAVSYAILSFVWNDKLF